MLSPGCVRELQTHWFPNVTDSGLDRLIELLSGNNPMLIHGGFCRTMPMGCLATHAAWHHPCTEHICAEAGIMWLTRVAGLNPATSQVIREWDARAQDPWSIRADMLQVFEAERRSRQRLLEESLELAEA